MAGSASSLVEADLRRPLMAGRLASTVVGTTNVLIGKVSLADALQQYADTGLQVLTCGPIPPNPPSCSSRTPWRPSWLDLRGAFEVIIIDALPLLPVTDAALLAAQADGAVVAVRHGSTTRDQLQHSLEWLEAVDAKALGVVINLAPSRKNRTGYAYGYGYGTASSPRPRSPASARAARRPPGPGRRAGRPSRRRRGRRRPAVAGLELLWARGFLPVRGIRLPRRDARDAGAQVRSRSSARCSSPPRPTPPPAS